MAKKVFIGVDNVARKVKKMYIGVDGVARKIKKAYIGVGGVARPFWAGGELVYYGLTTSRSPGSHSCAATAVGNYALFAGGDTQTSTSYSATAVVEAYDKSLTKTTATALSYKRMNLAATTVGGYAIFAGGYTQPYTTSGYNYVDAYTSSLVRSSPTALSSKRSWMAATTVGDYAIFAGGTGSYSGSENTIDIYNSSLVKTTSVTLSYKTYDAGATTIGDYAIIAGGDYNATTVNAFSSSLVRSTPTALSAGRKGVAATTVGNYALFAGGLKQAASLNNASSYTTVDVYDSSLARTTTTTLSATGYNSGATTLGDYAIFVGGDIPLGYTAQVTAFNSSLVKTDRSDDMNRGSGIAKRGGKCVGVTIGDYALFAGFASYVISDVMVYTLG